MFRKIKIWHFILFIIFSILVIRITYIINLFSLLLSLTQSLFTETKNIYSIIDFPVYDNFFSLLLIILLPVVIISSGKIRRLLSRSLRISDSLIVLLIICFIFAPIISAQHPDFQKNISVTKLLPPFSSVDYIELEKFSTRNEENIIELKNLINTVVPLSYNENIIFIDSISVDSAIICYQAKVKFNINKKLLKSINDVPIIRSKIFLLGSDEFGRDVFTRIIYGSRISLLVGFGAVLVSFILGLTFAFIAIEQGGFINLFFSRLTDLFLAFPTIFLVILIIALFGNNLISIIIVLGFSGWMSLFKIAKSEMLSIKNKEYYLSARLVGLKNIKLLLREILPAIIVPVSVNLIFQLSNVILAESALSYLGMGTGTEYPSWGSMIESGQRYITQSWWLIFIPGLTLVISLLSINEVGRDINKFFNPAIK
jgi:peptide/nickel transport system permease protein